MFPRKKFLKICYHQKEKQIFLFIKNNLMSSTYNKDLARDNKEKITKLINNFLNNSRLLAELTIDIARDVMKDNPKILDEDEQRCVDREKIEREQWISNQSIGQHISQDDLNRLKEESEIKIRKFRIKEAFIKLQSYLRLSYALDEQGYEWSKFFECEEDEPDEEAMIRQLLDNDSKRTELRHSTICKFIQHTYSFWPVIKNKDIDFLVNHLNTLFPNSEYTDKLEIIYGNNEDKKMYVSDQNLERVWRIIHGTIKTSIKYMHYIGKNKFNFKKTVNGVQTTIKTLEINIPDEIERWAVNLEVR